VNWCYAPRNRLNQYAVYDEEQRRVGSVFDIFGAVRTPTWL